MLVWNHKWNSRSSLQFFLMTFPSVIEQQPPKAHVSKGLASFFTVHSHGFRTVTNFSPTGSHSDSERRVESGCGSRCVLDVQRSTATRQLGSHPRRSSGQQSQRPRRRRFQSLRSVSGRQVPPFRVYAAGLAPIVPSNAPHPSNHLLLV